MSSSPSPSPSTLAIVFSTGILGLVTGYFLGQGASLGLFSSSSAARPANSSKAKSWPNSYDVVVHPDTSDEELMEHLRGKGNVKNSLAAITATAPAGNDGDSGNSDGSEEEEDDDEGEEEEEEEEEEGIFNASNAGLNAFEDSREEFKLVLVVRTDLGMQKGKIAAQCSHATLQNYKALLRSPAHSASLLSRWEAGGQAKIALQARGGVKELVSLTQAARREGLCALVVRDAGRTQVAGGTWTVLGVGPGPKGVVDRVTGGLKLL